MDRRTNCNAFKIFHIHQMKFRLAVVHKNGSGSICHVKRETSSSPFCFKEQGKMTET